MPLVAFDLGVQRVDHVRLTFEHLKEAALGMQQHPGQAEPGISVASYLVQFSEFLGVEGSTGRLAALA